MPQRKPTPARQRDTIIDKRAKARNLHYEMINIIKKRNQKNEPTGHNDLCVISDFHTVAKFIAEAESWGMIESHAILTEGNLTRIALMVTSVGDAFIKYCETHNKT